MSQSEERSSIAAIKSGYSSLRADNMFSAMNGIADKPVSAKLSGFALLRKCESNNLADLKALKGTIINSA